MYDSFVDADGNEYGSFEVFLNDGYLRAEDDPDRPRLADGWYWWACFPGCLPDGEPQGPFASEQEAHDDARSHP